MNLPLHQQKKLRIPPFYLHRVGVVIALSTVRISKVTFELCPQLFFEFFLNQIKTFNFQTFNGFKIESLSFK